MNNAINDWEGNGTPLQYSCLENPMDGGAWKAAVHGITECHTWLSDFTITFHFHALEKEMATHSSVLAWRIPGTGEPGGLPSMGSHKVEHDWSNLAAAAAACGIFTPWQRSEPSSPALEGKVISTGLPEKSPPWPFNPTRMGLPIAVFLHICLIKSLPWLKRFLLLL